MFYLHMHHEVIKQQITNSIFFHKSTKTSNSKSQFQKFGSIKLPYNLYRTYPQKNKAIKALTRRLPDDLSNGPETIKEHNYFETNCNLNQFPSVNFDRPRLISIN